MTADQKTARNEVMELLHTAWEANSTSAPIPLLWDNVNDDPPVPPASTSKAEAAPWARAQMRHNIGGQASLMGDSATQRYRRTGIITVEIRTPRGTGFDRLHDELIQIVKDAFEGETTPSQIEFRDGTCREVGQDGPWFHSNVLITFEYDEIK